MTYSCICERAPMTPSRAEDRKSTKTSPRRRPKRKPAVSDTRAEGAPEASGNAAPRLTQDSEEIDDEFCQRRLVAAERVRFVHSCRGYISIRKTARASRGAARFIDR